MFLNGLCPKPISQICQTQSSLFVADKQKKCFITNLYVLVLIKGNFFSKNLLFSYRQNQLINKYNQLQEYIVSLIFFFSKFQIVCFVGYISHKSVNSMKLCPIMSSHTLLSCCSVNSVSVALSTGITKYSIPSKPWRNQYRLIVNWSFKTFKPLIFEKKKKISESPGCLFLNSSILPLLQVCILHSIC